MPYRSRIKLTQLSLSRVRSSITNGRYAMPDVDHRSARMRRLRDLVALHLADLGGPENISHAEQVLVRRCAMLTLQLEMMEQKWASNNDGEAPTSALLLYQRTAANLRRILESLGLQRRPKDVSPPDLQTYLRQKANRSDDIEDAEVIQ
jgi:hypothetical protein